jgi:hypothetical protein
MTISSKNVKFTPVETEQIFKMRDGVDYIMSIAEGYKVLHEDTVVEVMPDSELHVVNGYKVRMAK